MTFDNIYNEVIKYEIERLIELRNYLDDSLPEIPYNKWMEEVNKEFKYEIMCCDCVTNSNFPNCKWTEVCEQCVNLDFKPILIDPKWFYNILKYKQFIIKCQNRIKQRYYKNKMLQKCV